MSKILIIEDELMLQDMMSSYLEANGYEITTVANYDNGLSLAYEKSFDLWIFDVKIIGGSGFNLLEELRKNGKNTPCIFTTSLNTIEDLNIGFKVGCDDYIKKPFELKELLLRVQNLLKREFFHNSNKVLNLGSELSYDISSKTLFNGKKDAGLSKKENELLALFLKNQNKIVSREQIYEALWDYDEIPSEMSLRVYIRNLRKILGDEKIISKSKIGYIYVS